MKNVPQDRWNCCHCGTSGWWTPSTQVGPRPTVDHDRPDGRRCAKAALEREGNRETLRRAQKTDKTETSETVWRKRLEAASEELADVGAGECGRLDIVSRVRMLKARLATLQVAGEVPSQHADKTAGTPSRFGDAGAADVVLRCMSCRGDHPHRWFLRASEQGEGWRCSNCGESSSALRYPCSLTCTHDDAAIPGHAERVKEESEAFKSELELEDDHPEAFAAGAEAMRAACLEAVMQVVDAEGAGSLADRLKTAIEGATS